MSERSRPSRFRLFREAPLEVIIVDFLILYWLGCISGRAWAVLLVGCLVWLLLPAIALLYEARK